MRFYLGKAVSKSIRAKAELSNLNCRILKLVPIYIRRNANSVFAREPSAVFTWQIPGVVFQLRKLSLECRPRSFYRRHAGRGNRGDSYRLFF